MALRIHRFDHGTLMWAYRVNSHSLLLNGAGLLLGNLSRRLNMGCYRI